ncbi:DJ-1 protein-PfpI domain-containing protein [Mycena kentingensis (nom. inval.)]|nr:DJ-1 protein-PfpI domain-containing protein [Mycena kentingensis (nom. inval.)]
MSTDIRTYTIAVCLIDDVTMSDFIPPVEILGGLNLPDHPFGGALVKHLNIPYRVKIEYLAPTMAPVRGGEGLGGPTVNPTMTYKEAMAKEGGWDVTHHHRK